MPVGLMAYAAAAALAPDVASGSWTSGRWAIGRWATETRGAIVEIAPCGPSLCGTLVTSDGIRANPELRDARNRNPALRQRTLRGLPMLQGLRWQSGAWSGGTLYNPDDGGTYSGSLTIVARDRLRLKGCIVWPLCKSQTWTRAR